MISGAYWAHVMSAVILIGLSVVSYFCLLQAYYYRYMKSDVTLRTLIITDALISLPLVLLTITCGMMINLPGDSYLSYPWIFSSCVYLSMATLCLTINVFVKIFYYFKLKTTGIYRLTFLFHLVNILLILLLIVITHDMITKQTWLSAMIQTG